MKGFQFLKPISTWDVDAARHILSRTIFGFTQQDVEFALSMNLDDFVDNYLLAEQDQPAAPGDWVNEVPIPNNGKVDRARLQEMVYWWLELMQNQDYSLRERMVLFWHNHFVSEFSDVKYPQLMYIQNDLFRKHALGNIIELTEAVTIDPAMLKYLDGQKNTKNRPNENYARELLELFTMGIGHYTEQDIGEAARALTGWKIDGLNAVFNTNQHDFGSKTFLGQTGNFAYNDIINIIFQQEATANFLCEKIYKEFVFYKPNETFVAELAKVMRNNNYELKPTLSVLFKSDYFHSEDIRSEKIKSPVEFLVSALRQYSIPNPNYQYIHDTAKDLQQELFEPPDVRGWEGQRKWISTSTYPLRNQFTDSLINGFDYNGKSIGFTIDVLTYARSFDSSENATQFIEDVSKTLIQFTLSESRKQNLLDTLLDGSAVYEWSTNHPQAETRLKKFFRALMRLPEYQLC